MGGKEGGELRYLYIYSMHREIEEDAEQRVLLVDSNCYSPMVDIYGH